MIAMSPMQILKAFFDPPAIRLEELKAIKASDRENKTHDFEWFVVEAAKALGVTVDTSGKVATK